MLQLDHVVFPVRDAEATLAFYRDLLGLPLVECHQGDDWGGYPWLMMIFGLSGKQEIVRVALRGAPAPDEPPPSFKNKTILIPNYDPYSCDLIVAAFEHAGYRTCLIEETPATVVSSLRLNDGQCLPISSPMLSGPTYQFTNGGISQTASAVNRLTISSTSLRQNAST